MAVERIVRMVVEVKYSMADGSSADTICASSMADNVLAELESIRAMGELTPENICADELTLEMLDTHTN